MHRHFYFCSEIAKRSRCGVNVGLGPFAGFGSQCMRTVSSNVRVSLSSTNVSCRQPAGPSHGKE